MTKKTATTILREISEKPVQLDENFSEEQANEYIDNLKVIAGLIKENLQIINTAFNGNFEFSISTEESNRSPNYNQFWQIGLFVDQDNEVDTYEMKHEDIKVQKAIDDLNSLYDLTQNQYLAAPCECEIIADKHNVTIMFYPVIRHNKTIMVSV